MNKPSLTINHRITWPALLILVIYCIPMVVWQEESLGVLNAIFAVIVDYGGNFYVWFSILMTLASLYFICTKYGSVVLGAPDSKPRFGWGAYLSIIVAMGIGSTIMRTGVITWAPIAQAPPLGLEPLTESALAFGNAYGMYLWSFQTFAIFSMGAPAIGYLLYVRRTPVLRMSEIYRCIFGNRFVDGAGGIVVDILFLVAIVAGAATFLGLGTPIVTAIVAKILGVESSFALTFCVTLVWIVLFTASVMLGLEKGIKVLSSVNMYVAAMLGVFIIIAGPTTFIFGFFFDTLASLASNFHAFVINTPEPPGVEGAFDVQRYTIFWWAYGATWSLLHSIFAAKISEGRTIRQLLLSYLLAPLALAWIATAILGGLGAGVFSNGSVPVMEILNDKGQMAAIAEIVGSVTGGLLTLVVFSILTMTFFATTLDSTTFSVSAYTDTNDMHKQDPSGSIRLMWSLIISVIALVLMKVGGLAPLEVTSGLLGLPIVFIQLSAVYAAKKMMDEDEAWKYNVRGAPTRVTSSGSAE
ncbi:BCCT family transporter [Halomonas cupida]|uniref:BCCT family transporter n=1 Tax=Halomonas cupida TaxID=44933 RepID=UPI0039B6A0BB